MADFWSNLALLTLPLLVLGALSALLYRVGLEDPRGRAGARHQPRS